MEASTGHIKLFLRSLRMYNAISGERLDKAMSLYERLTKTTSAPTGMPSGGGADRGSVLASFADSVTDAGQWLDICEAKHKLVMDFLNDAPLSETHRAILVNRYIRRMKWAAVIYEIRDLNKMSLRKVFYEHNKALEICAEWVNRTGKYKKEVLEV